MSDDVKQLRETLEEIGTHAHCLAKAGPLNTPTLAAAWSHFMQLSVMATAALHRSRIAEIQEAQKHAHTVPLKLD
jgi:hypothetical protein